MVVIEFAKSGRAACRTCNGFIAEDSMKLGTAKNNDGYLNMEWHHARCFWTRRAAKYYKRKGKKSNGLLRLSQFSGQHHLDADQLKEISDKILECNQRWGSKEALEKEGIPVLVRDEAAEAAEKKAKADKRKADKELKLAQEAVAPTKMRATRSSVVQVDEAKVIEAPEVEDTFASGRKKRKTTK